MTKAGPIRPSGLVPQQPAQTLNQKEKAHAKQQQAKALSADDAARLASQAGFQRTTRKKGARKGGFDVGDSSQAPIPLPNDDTDTEAWSQERLDSAQGNLTLANAQFSEIAKGVPAGASLGASVVGSSFMPTEDDLEELEDLAQRKPPHPTPMLEEMSNSVSALFGIELDDDVPVGHKVLAAGLVVAGETESVRVDKGSLKEKELAGGLQKVTDRGNQAVGEAQKMSKGINKELNLQRTFMFKR